MIICDGNECVAIKWHFKRRCIPQLKKIGGGNASVVEGRNGIAQFGEGFGDKNAVGGVANNRDIVESIKVSATMATLHLTIVS